MDYYEEKQYIIAVDENDVVLNRIERWEAHEKGILHRAFTVGLRHTKGWVVQHRRHPVFNSVLDISSSSHPFFSKQNSKEEMEDQVVSTIYREWSLSEGAISKGALQYCGKVYYKAKDSMSDYVEHEICHIYVVDVPEAPMSRSEYAFGSSIIPDGVLFNPVNPLQQSFAPWVKPMLPILQNTHKL